MCTELLMFETFDRMRWPELWVRGILDICESLVSAVLLQRPRPSP